MRGGRLTPAEIEPVLPWMAARKVSEVARGPRGFLTRFFEVHGDWDQLGMDPYTGQNWVDRQRAFVERHWAQAENTGESVWETYQGQRVPTRRHLAFVAWAWSPDLAGYRSWLRTLTSGPRDRLRVRLRTGRRPGLRVQSLLMDKEEFTEEEARHWAVDHDFVAGKVDPGTPNARYYRIRQFLPDQHEPSSFRTSPEWRPGVKAIYARPCTSCSQEIEKETNERLETAVTRRREDKVYLILPRGTFERWQQTPNWTSRLARELPSYNFHSAQDIAGKFLRGELSITRSGLTLGLEDRVLLATDANRENILTPNGLAPPILTQTRKMACPSFSLPAGTLPEGGTCPAAEYHPGPPEDQQRICASCYALKGNYIFNGVMISQTMRLGWVRQELRHPGRLTQELVSVLGSLPVFGSTPGSEFGLAFHDRFAIGGRHTMPNYPLVTGGLSRPVVPEGTLTGYFRIHDSGDFGVGDQEQILGYIESWRQVAQTFPHVWFWAPSRLWVIQKGAIRAALDRLAAQPNLILRPSALYFDDVPPNVPRWAAGTTAGNVGSDIYACPVTQGGPSSCFNAGCRACWRMPETQISYHRH